MAKKKNNGAITRVGSSELAKAPEFMGDERQGVEELATYVVPPRMKVVQKQADQDLLDKFPVGSVILSPNDLPVSVMEIGANGQPTGDSPPFLFVPIFFYPEFCTWNPIELKGKSPSIHARSFDPAGEIAAKSRNPDLRYEAHPDHPDYKMRHVEHLNFVVQIAGEHELAGEPFIMTFSRGEHGSGRKLCSLIKMRKASIFGCIFQAQVNPRTNDMGDWWGVDVGNPTIEGQSPWVGDEETFLALKTVHEEFATAHAKQLIRVDYGDEDSDEPNKPDGDKF